MSWDCFMIRQTGRALHLIAHTRAAWCPAAPEGHCIAFALIGEADLVLSERQSIPELPIARDDGRIPARCATCGERLGPDARATIRQEPIYVADDGRRFSVRPSWARYGVAAADAGLPPAPAGAMWVADWVEPGDGWTGPDGLCLMLRLPDGHDWMIDGPARSGGGWTRTGTPPQITARPSIASPRYHGWLTDGVLSDDLEGRTYEP